MEKQKQSTHPVASGVENLTLSRHRAGRIRARKLVSGHHKGDRSAPALASALGFNRFRLQPQCFDPGEVLSEECVQKRSLVGSQRARFCGSHRRTLGRSNIRFCRTPHVPAGTPQGSRPFRLSRVRLEPSWGSTPMRVATSRSFGATLS